MRCHDSKLTGIKKCEDKRGRSLLSSKDPKSIHLMTQTKNKQKPYSLIFVKYTEVFYYGIQHECIRKHVLQNLRLRFFKTKQRIV